MAIFLLETTWVALGFFLSFNFWLDLIATASMVLDFEVLWQECASVDTPGCLFRDAEVASEEEALAVLGSIQTATRIGRVLRLFRVVRVFRLIALIGKKQKEEEERSSGPTTSVLTSLVNQQLDHTILRMLTLDVVHRSERLRGAHAEHDVPGAHGVERRGGDRTAQKVQGGCVRPRRAWRIASGARPRSSSTSTTRRAWRRSTSSSSRGPYNIVNTPRSSSPRCIARRHQDGRAPHRVDGRPRARLAENPTLQLAVQSKSKYETESVRVALAKIVGLMQLGFGGAGHEIISANLANSDKTGLDLMLRGKKRTARTASATSGSSPTRSSACRTR